MVAAQSADGAKFAAAVECSLDRKVCNTLNVVCVVRACAAELVPLLIAALARAGVRRGGAAPPAAAAGAEAEDVGNNFKVHVVPGDEAALPEVRSDDDAEYNDRAFEPLRGTVASPVPEDVRGRTVAVRRADGTHDEPQVKASRYRCSASLGLARAPGNYLVMVRAPAPRARDATSTVDALGSGVAA